MKTVSTEKAPAAIGPYSQAQIAGGFVFASGQIAIIPETGAIAEGLEAQAHQVFKNITALLSAAGVAPPAVHRKSAAVTAWTCLVARKPAC